MDTAEDPATFFHAMADDSAAAMGAGGNEIAGAQLDHPLAPLAAVFGVLPRGLTGLLCHGGPRLDEFRCNAVNVTGCFVFRQGD